MTTAPSAPRGAHTSRPPGPGAWRALPGLAWAAIAVGVVALQLVHVGFRPTGWVHEWRWAVYQYQFSTVLLAPLAAGGAAVLGRRWARARSQLATGARGGTALVGGVVPLAVVVVLAYLGSFVAVVARAEAVGWPSPADLAPFVPALAQLLLVVAVGYVAGWTTRSWLAAPLVAVVVFGALLGGWLAGRTPLVQVGGATASLVGLAVDPDVVVGQVVGYLALVGALLGGVVAHLRRSSPVPPALAATVAGVAVAGLAVHPGDPLVAIDEPLVCEGTAPTICTAEPYRHLAPDLRVRVEPVLERLRAAGVEPPTELRQAFYLDLPPGVGSVTADALTGEAGSTRFAVRSAYERPFCASPEEAIRQGGLVVAFDELVSATSPPTPEDRARLAQVTADLASTCTGPPTAATPGPGDPSAPG